MWFISSAQALLVPSNAEPVLALHWVNGVCKLFLYGPMQSSVFAQLLFFVSYSKSPCGRNMFKYSLLDVFSKDALIRKM